jgi:uncharacterized protein (TIGR04141 family)
MGASNFTIYQLETDKTWKQIIDEFNEDKDEDKKFRIKTNSNKKFKNIIEYNLYTRAASTTPDWVNPILHLVKDLGEVENINNSYVLFMKVGNESYVATGGQGYSVIETDKNFQFGIELLSRLISNNESVIKSISNRYIAGNIVGGNYQFHENVSAELESGFNRYFSKIYTALPAKTIKKKLNIDIKTKKEDYRFLAKDSIRLSKSLTINELDNLVGAIHQLMEEEGFPINPVSFVHKKDPVQDKLNEQLMKKLMKHIETLDADNEIRIVPFFHELDEHYIQMDGQGLLPYENEADIISYLQNLSADKTASVLLSIMKKIKLIGKIEGEEIVEANLFTHLEATIIQDDKTYWLRDGEWLYFEKKFIAEINDRFIANIANHPNQNFEIKEMNMWPEKEDEGTFNFNHNEIPNFYVLDKILYKTIEICDLLVDNEEGLFFVHVKDGFDRDVRVLVNQMENAMLAIYRGIHSDRQVLKDYYKSIVDKIKESESGKDESKLSSAARKFRASFPDDKSFIELLTRRQSQISFVFAYRPLASHNLRRPETIGSFPAKLSMLHLVKSMRDHDFDLKFLKVMRDSEELADVKEVTYK